MELHDKREYKNDIIYVIDEKKRDEIFEANRKSGLRMQLSYSIPPGSKILSRKENLEYYDKLVSDFEDIIAADQTVQTDSRLRSCLKCLNRKKFRLSQLN